MFREIVLVDFEFEIGQGERPVPVCLVAHEWRSGRRFRLMRDELGPAPPYATGRDVLLVAYYSSAELGCYRVLGWPMPDHTIDLFAEFRNLTNGLPTPAGASLLGALTYFGLDGMGAAEKKEMQTAIGDGTWRTNYTADEVLDYCETDVEALLRLLPVMEIDIARALLRGRYMAAVALMEHFGTPIDMPMLDRFRDGWTGIQDRLIAEIDVDYGVYDERTFKRERFAAWLGRNRIPWPQSGRLDLGDETFRQQAKAHPLVSSLR
jgi:hypothetical protein